MLCIYAINVVSLPKNYFLGRHDQTLISRLGELNHLGMPWDKLWFGGHLLNSVLMVSGFDQNLSQGGAYIKWWIWTCVLNSLIISQVILPQFVRMCQSCSVHYNCLYYGAICSIRTMSIISRRLFMLGHSIGNILPGPKLTCIYMLWLPTKRHWIVRKPW